MPLDDLLLKVKNRKLVVTVVPVLAGALIGMTMVVKPSLKKLSGIKTETSGLSQKQTIYGDIVEKDKRLTDYRDKLSKIPDRTKFIEELNTLAAQSGLSVQSVAPDEKKAVATYLEKVAVKIDAEGNYHQLGEFVSRVESLEPFVKIMSVSIDTEGGDEAEGSGAVAAPRIRTSSGNTYRVSLDVGLFFPGKEF